MLQDEKKTAPVFTAVDVNIADAYVALTSFASDLCPETLSKHRLARTDVTSYQYSLSHFLRELQHETEEFHE